MDFCGRVLTIHIYVDIDTDAENGAENTTKRKLDIFYFIREHVPSKEFYIQYVIVVMLDNTINFGDHWFEAKPPKLKPGKASKPTELGVCLWVCILHANETVKWQQ